MHHAWDCSVLYLNLQVFFPIKLFLHIQFLKKVWHTENLEVCLHWLNLEMELPPT